jgi:hypothetical protein
MMLLFDTSSSAVEEAVEEAVTPLSFLFVLF